MRSFMLTKCARRAIRMGGTDPKALGKVAQRKARRAVRMALHSAADHEHWDDRINLKPATSWDVN